MIVLYGLNSLSAKEGNWDYPVSSCVIKTAPSASPAIDFFLVYPSFFSQMNILDPENNKRIQLSGKEKHAQHFSPIDTGHFYTPYRASIPARQYI